MQRTTNAGNSTTGSPEHCTDHIGHNEEAEFDRIAYNAIYMQRSRHPLYRVNENLIQRATTEEVLSELINLKFYLNCMTTSFDRLITTFQRMQQYEKATKKTYNQLQGKDQQ